MNSVLAEPPVVQGHQRPRISLIPEAASSESGVAALEVCRLAGLGLDPWQEFVLVSALGEREDGKWSAFEVGETVPRQNGKGTTLEARELTGLFAIDEEKLLIHSAHEQATSSEHFRRLLSLIESVPDFDEQVMKAPKGKGAEAIELRDGSRILFKTRTGGGGRGLTGDLVVLDEAMILPVATTGALVPTMAARSVHGNPQLWYAASAVDQQIHEHGIVLSRVRSRALAGGKRLMYVEFSAPGDDPDDLTESERMDPQVWAQANPGLGIRISVEHVANEAAGALDPRTFAVERLGIGDWFDEGTDSKAVIDAEAWASLGDRASRMEDPVVFVFDVTPDRGSASICVAGVRPDGLSHVEVIDRRPGTGWVAQRVAELEATHDTEAVLCDGKGPAAALIPRLDRLGVRVETTTASEHAEACGVFFDAVTDRTVRHLGTQEMAAAIAAAVKRPLGDAWAWSRRSSTVDISPLVGCTLALWRLMNVTADKPGFEIWA